MYLVFVISTLHGGGAEKAVAVLANHFVSRGMRIDIVCTEHGECVYTLDPRVRIVALKSRGMNRSVVGKCLAPPVQALELAWRLRRDPPEATISFLVRPNFCHVLTRLWGHRQAVILTEQIASKAMYDTSGWLGKVMLALTKQLYSKADHVVAASQGVKDGLRTIGVRKTPITVIHNPISIQEITTSVSLKKAARAEHRPLQVVTMGRLCEQKDQVTLLQAFREVLDLGIHAELTILGEGPLRDTLRQVVNELGLSQKVRLQGWAAKPFRQIGGSDLFVLSSRYEGFANVLVEAMACGVPVSSTDCPSGPSEILQNGKFGSLVPVGDSSALAQQMYTVLTMTHTQRTELGRENLKRAKLFDVSSAAEQYLAVINGCALTQR